MHHRRPALVLIGLLAASLSLVACEEEVAGDGAVASALAEQGAIVRTPTEAAPFVLAKGLYKVGWKTTGCTSITVELAGDNGYSKKQTSTVPNHSFIATGVGDGNYTITQSEASCVDWSVTVEKIGG